MCVGKVPNQFECDDRPDACARPAHSTHRGHRIALGQIGRQDIRDCRERTVTERSQREQHGDCRQVHGYDGRDEQHHSNPTEDDYRLAGCA